MLASASLGFMAVLVRKIENIFGQNWGRSRAFKGGGGGGGGSGCITRDFNSIRFPKECSKGGRLNSGMRRFSEVIKDLELREVLYVGGFSRGVEV